MHRMRILFCCNTLQGFCNFRLDVVRHLVGKGNEAIIVYPSKKGVEKALRSLPDGCKAVPCEMSPNGKSLVQDARLLFRLLHIFKKEAPDIVFNYTVKPNIYGGIAARLRNIPSVAMAPGLGYTFACDGWVGVLLRRYYTFGLSLAEKVMVLNSSDLDRLAEAGIDRKKAVLLQGGEGVDLDRYPFTEGDYNNIGC